MCRIQLTIVLVAVVGLINAADTVPKTGPAVLGEFTKIGLSNCVGTQLAAVPGDVTSIAYLIPNTTARVTSVVLIAPSSDTHTFNMHQRIVELEILDSDNDNNHVGVDGDRSVTVRGPPNANVAPPGPYMIFLLSGRTWGPAQWINVVRN
eukprot:XP_001697906.1 predicted protein [Chlamydomonas reinhardtii]